MKRTKRKRRNSQGFTLAELLIVVAIIAVLAAISIPVFSSQLNRSKYASDEANARSIYALMSADYLANGGSGQSQGFNVDNLSVANSGTAATVTVTDPDGSKTEFKFNGIAGVTITLGTATTPPSVKIAPDNRYNDGEVVFGTK